MSLLTTADEVVKALGGLSEAAKLIEGGTPQKLWNWKSAGRFPPHTFAALKIALNNRGHDAPDSLWGMAKPLEAAE